MYRIYMLSSERYKNIGKSIMKALFHTYADNKKRTLRYQLEKVIEFRIKLSTDIPCLLLII